MKVAVAAPLRLPALADRRGRPLGSPRSACPAFTAARVGRRLACFRVAALMSAAGYPTSASTIHGWELEGHLPSEERIEGLAWVFCESEQTVAAWFGLSLAAASGGH